MEAALFYIGRKDLDVKKWNNLISASPNGLAYAHSEMLDAMSPGWDALVLGDYLAIMPLTWRSKFGIRYLCQPAFCQQLGIFSIETLSQEITESFLRQVVLRFRLAEIYLHYATPLVPGLSQHTNLLLQLNNPYETIRAQYRNDLLKNLTRGSKYHLTYIKSDNVSHAITLYKSYYGKKLGYRQQDYEAFTLLCNQWINQDRCFVREVYLKAQNRHELLAVGLFLKDHKRIYNIASTTLPNGRTLEANHFLFDQLIREFAGKPFILDFEGSDLPGVARFYQKFRPENQPFYFWKTNRLPPILKWWKKK